MRATQGALIVASTLQIVLGFSGLWRNVARLVQNSKPELMIITSTVLEQREKMLYDVNWIIDQVY